MFGFFVFFVLDLELLFEVRFFGLRYYVLVVNSFWFYGVVFVFLFLEGIFFFFKIIKKGLYLSYLKLDFGV